MPPRVAVSPSRGYAALARRAARRPLEENLAVEIVLPSEPPLLQRLQRAVLTNFQQRLVDLF